MKIKHYLFIFFCLISTMVEADNGHDFGDYIVYSNAFTADTLPAQMATLYGITRSKYKGVLNISIQKKGPVGTLTTSENAKVLVQATNLAGQVKSLEFRRVAEDKAIYYISEFNVANEELIRFNVSVLPENSAKLLEFNVKHQFYTD